MLLDSQQPEIQQWVARIRGMLPLRPKENFGQNTVPIHMHDKYAAGRDGHRGDDPHGVTGPLPAPVSDEEASVRPGGAAPEPVELYDEQTEYPADATEGIDYTRNQDYGAKVQNY
jgi:hypothetical protein